MIGVGFRSHSFLFSFNLSLSHQAWRLLFWQFLNNWGKGSEPGDKGDVDGSLCMCEEWISDSEHWLSQAVEPLSKALLFIEFMVSFS